MGLPLTTPVITTLLSPNPASGNTTTDGTEQTLASGTAAAGTYQCLVDTTNMVDGDIIELRCYTKSNGSATEHQEFYASFGGAQGDAVKASPIIPTAADVKFTIKRTAGTDRAYQWGVNNLNGT